MNRRKVPTRTEQAQPSARSSSSEISSFLAQAKQVGNPRDRGNLILALDATMSRQPTWDLACSLQGQMFQAVEKVGGLAVQLVYFRGFGECRSSKFVSNSKALATLMSRIECRGGHTQIGKVLSHICRQNEKARVNAAVFIGDALEEKIDDLCNHAGQLGLKGVPLFLFQEGNDAQVKSGFRELARLSGGAVFAFDRNAPQVLADLLSSIGVFVAGGLPALERRGRASDRKLLENLKSSGRK